MVGTVYWGSSLLFFRRLNYLIPSDENKLYFLSSPHNTLLQSCLVQCKYSLANFFRAIWFFFEINGFQLGHLPNKLSHKHLFTVESDIFISEYFFYVKVICGPVRQASQLTIVPFSSFSWSTGSGFCFLSSTPCFYLDPCTYNLFGYSKLTSSFCFCDSTIINCIYY